MNRAPEPKAVRYARLGERGLEIFAGLSAAGGSVVSAWFAIDLVETIIESGRMDLRAAGLILTAVVPVSLSVWCARISLWYLSGQKRPQVGGGAVALAWTGAGALAAALFLGITRGASVVRVVAALTLIAVGAGCMAAERRRRPKVSSGA